MAIFLAPTVPDTKLEKLQQAEGSPIAIARQSVLTGVAPDPLLVKTSERKLKRLLTLLPHKEMRGRGLLMIRSQDDPEDKLKVVCPKALKKPMA